MDITNNKKIQNLSIEQFTAFEDANFEFCSGINVLIGANSTGKTLTMKLAYTILKICQTLYEKNVRTDDSETDVAIATEFSYYGVLIDSKLAGVFQCQQLRELIRSDSFEEDKQSVMKTRLGYSGSSIHLMIQYNPDKPQKEKETSFMLLKPGSLTASPSVIYLPSHEILSMNQGFISLYQNRELPYDETFFDLSLALNTVPLRHEKLDGVRQIILFLEEILAQKAENTMRHVVTQENNRFYFKLPEGQLEAHLVAEGYRKIGTLLYLLKNGSLTKDSILFWDEPEANLNPKLVVQIAEVLKMLAATGMQIFITTHDYLLSHELSLTTEYQTNADINIKFFALHKPSEKAGVAVESGQTLAEITNNLILEEFAAHYDRETALFQRTNE